MQHSALALGKEKIKMKKEVDNYQNQMGCNPFEYLFGTVIEYRVRVASSIRKCEQIVNIVQFIILCGVFGEKCRKSENIPKISLLLKADFCPYSVVLFALWV